MKNIRTDNMRIHLSRHDGNCIMWINGINKFILNRKTEIIINGLIDNFDRTSVHTLQNESLLNKVVDIAVDEFQCDRDFVKVYTWFVIDNILKFSKTKLLHPLLLKSEYNNTSLSPTRMDLAITYQCNNQCYFCYADCPRYTIELSTQDWKNVIDKLGELEVTTLNFTGGEPTLRDDLEDIMSYAKSKFMIMLTTNGRTLTDELCARLKKSGLGFAQITLHSFEEIHDSMCRKKGSWKETVNGIKSSVASGIQTATNTTLMRNNYLDIVDFVEFVYGIGVRDICFNSLLVSGKGMLFKSDDARLTYDELKSILKTINVTAKSLPGLRIQWLCPTCYLRLNPIELGFGDKGCSACNFNMSVEPDGRVIPCQSWIHEGCGNIVTDDWSSIWKSKVAEDNKLSHVVEECNGCKWGDRCKGACPLDKSWVVDVNNLYGKELVYATRGRT